MEWHNNLKFAVEIENGLEAIDPKRPSFGKINNLCRFKTISIKLNQSCNYNKRQLIKFLLINLSSLTMQRCSCSPHKTIHAI